MHATVEAPPAFRMTSPLWLLVLVVLSAATVAFLPAIEKMIGTWFGRPEYSHGVLIPLIACFLVWQRSEELSYARFTGSWAGVALIACGGLLQLLGSLAALYVLQQYALLLVLYGVLLSITGWDVFKRLWVPLLILVFMIPLPEFLLNNFSAQLQLISSQIGVWFIRLFGISVFVEGNVIDLGSYKLQVAEACDGLRYLFPLMTLGFIMAYFYKSSMWKRVLLFLSSIPITILMNSFRIGTIGVMVEHWGVSMAEGFLHEFQGWAVFMVSGALLVAEMALLSQVGRERGHWREIFGLEFPAPFPGGVPRQSRTVPRQFKVACVALLSLAAGLLLVPEKHEVIPGRETFGVFPNEISGWTGRRESMEQIYLDTLKLDDYVLANYQRSGSELVNFYVAWYDSQRSGKSTHSPRSCIPGGGWRITSLEQITLADVSVGGVPVRANRVLIEYRDQKQVVYYWFQQRGRVITNEYLVKWYLFWDSLNLGRSDGALVRLVAPLRTGEDVATVDRRLTEFARAVTPQLVKYVPG